MSLAARLTKLEEKAGKGKWCAYCRLALRCSPPVASVFARTRDVPASLKRKCRFCDNHYNVQQPEGDTPRDRALRLLNSYQYEDFFTDEKACAVAAWVRQSRNRTPEESERREQRRRAAASRGRGEKPTREQRLRRQLFDEVKELFRRWRKEIKAKYGDPFPHVYELERIIAATFYKWSPAADELERWRAWAALERIVFGDPLPETAAHVAEYEEKVAAEEAEKERKEAERMEREQRPYGAGAARPHSPGQWR